MKGRLAVVVLIAAATAFYIGVVELFELRFETGDVYPQYSSLRSDPLGTMAFYESLAQMRDVSVQRDLTTSTSLPLGNAMTYLYVAAPVFSLQTMPQSTIRDIERFARDGGRFVITLFGASVPVDVRESPNREWGVEFALENLQRKGDTFDPAIVTSFSGSPVSPTLDWHSGIVFKHLNSDWKPIYVRDGKPVMIERKFGAGSVVIATDSYFLSNEAMLNDRHADLLAFLIGANRNVIFDEAHLGVTEEPGMATLMRRYRLHWVGVSLLLIAALFIWKMSMPLVPTGGAGALEDFIPGRNTAAGIINLLRRSIPPAELLQTCFKEWKKSISESTPSASARVREAEAALASERDPVAAYRSISRILERKIQ